MKLESLKSRYEGAVECLDMVKERLNKYGANVHAPMFFNDGVSVIIRKRDVAWLTAIIPEVDVKTLHLICSRFNSLRPD